MLKKKIAELFFEITNTDLLRVPKALKNEKLFSFMRWKKAYDSSELYGS